jgi:enoyl-CoA hydratase
MPAVLYEKKDHIAIVTMNRKADLNAMDDEMMEQLSDAWIDIRDDRNIWAAIITGAGRTAFSVGGDLKTFIPKIVNADLRDLQSDTRPLNAVLRGFDVWKPIVAAVNGFCFGGGLEMLLGTDIRVASENAVFAVMEPTWALFPGGGTTVRLPRQIPYAKAMEMLLTANQVTAQEAADMGLINKVVPHEELMPTAMTPRTPRRESRPSRRTARPCGKAGRLPDPTKRTERKPAFGPTRPAFLLLPSPNRDLTFMNRPPTSDAHPTGRFRLG